MQGDERERGGDVKSSVLQPRRAESSACVEEALKAATI